jgi:flagellar biosynthesis protein FlhG
MPDSPRFIAIASGKGGVGKTWLAISLSHALTRAGLHVLVIDADLGLANVDVQLGLVPKVDLGSVIFGRTDVAGAITRHCPTGIDVVAGQSGSGALSGLLAERLDMLLTQIRRETAGYDAVLVDLGAGLDRTVRRIAAWSDLLLVVATDEPTSLTDAYAVLKLQFVDQPDGHPEIVINQAQSTAAGQQTYSTLRRACKAFLHREPPLAGVIRLDPKVRDAIRHQMPLLLRHPNSPAAQDVEALAHKYLEGWSRAGRCVTDFYAPTLNGATTTHLRGLKLPTL